MALGVRVGSFEITAKIGAGGMGEVWRAHDAQLGRDVALKVLPEEFTQDPERLARFEREAKVLAQLNHQNIAHIYGLEASGATRALVMELVEGPTLADRLRSGPLPVNEALSIARQIAEALEEAHEKGIIHRDLKPANIKASPDGRVKVLDFGLAKAFESKPASEASPSLAHSPTLTLGTMQGVILGTAAYMAPEQAKGLPVDKRADIWAFGVVLWEMLTGKSLFASDTLPGTLARVIEREIDFESLPGSTPTALRRLIRRCLERNPRDRLHDIADARLVIDDTLAGRGEFAVPNAAAQRGRPPWQFAAAGLVVGLLVAFAISNIFSRRMAPSSSVPISATIELLAPLQLLGADRSIALSPDGTQLAFSAGNPAEGTVQLYLRPLSRLEARPLAGTRGATYPFWSPDGRSLGFFADGKLKRIDLDREIVRNLCDAPVGRGGTWSPRGFVVFAPGAVGSLLKVSADGGSPTAYTTLEHEGENERLPQILPDGRSILFWARNRGMPGDAAVYAFDPEHGRTKKVLDTETEARYVSPGYLAFVREGNLMLQPFDAKRLVLSGEPKPIASAVHYDLNRRFLNLDLGAGGRLVYQQVQPSPGVQFYWLDGKGEEKPAWTGPSINSGDVPRLSHDGRRLVTAVCDIHVDCGLQILDLDHGTSERVGESRLDASFAAFSPGDERLAFTAEIDGEYQVAWSGARGGEAVHPLTSDRGMEQHAGDFTPDGRSILFSSWSNVDKRGDLFLVDLDGRTPKRAFLAGPASEALPRISPDGTWVAYLSDASGSIQVWVTDFPGAHGRWQVSTSAATPYPFPLWLSAGELSWQDSDGKLGVVKIRARSGDLEIGARRILLGGRVLKVGEEAVVAYSPERQRFLLARIARPQLPPKLVVISDWRAELMGGAIRQ